MFVDLTQVEPALRLLGFCSACLVMDALPAHDTHSMAPGHNSASHSDIKKIIKQCPNYTLLGYFSRKQYAH